jgi:branched-chain amino acid transport system ATP-binding protein
LADRHFVLEKGVVVWSGTSGDLRANAQIVHEYLGV